jgi:hypothetical protein
MMKWVKREPFVEFRMPHTGQFVLFFTHTLPMAICGVYVGEGRFMAMMGHFPEFKIYELEYIHAWAYLPHISEVQDGLI